MLKKIHHVAVVVRDADQANAPPQPSPVAENLLKERIKQFGFRTWSEDGPPDPKTTPDFIVLGEAQVKRLQMRLAASGVVVTKYALNSWTVKCIDRATGEEHHVELAGVFVQIGLVPNTEWLRGTLELSKYGEIIIDAKCHTSAQGVFAAGDVTTVPYKQIIIATGEGSKAALSAFDHLIRTPVAG